MPQNLQLTTKRHGVRCGHTTKSGRGVALKVSGAMYKRAGCSDAITHVHGTLLRAWRRHRVWFCKPFAVCSLHESAVDLSGLSVVLQGYCGANKSYSLQSVRHLQYFDYVSTNAGHNVECQVLPKSDDAVANGNPNPISANQPLEQLIKNEEMRLVKLYFELFTRSTKTHGYIINLFVLYESQTYNTMRRALL